MIIKKKNRQTLEKSQIKEILGRYIIKKGGVPRFLIKYIIEDLINVGHLEKVNRRTYKVKMSDRDKRIRQLMFAIN